MTTVELSIDEENKSFILSGDIESLLKNYRAKYYLLDFLQAIIKDEKYVIIPYTDEEKEEILKKLQDSFQKYGISQVDSEKIKSTLEHYYQERENFRRFSLKAKDIWNNKVDLKEFREFENVLRDTIPQRKLYDKQLLASFHLTFSQNACNFSVPGAGKTSIVYAAYAFLKHLPDNHPKKINRLVVIGPLSSFGPWEDEYFECFGCNPLSIRLSGGIPKEDRDNYLLSLRPINEMPELTLLSYQSVPLNLPNLIYFLKRQGSKTMVVLDEAHRIKNVEGGVWAQAALELAKYASARVVLTGTPLPNGYEDIYNLFEFIWPGKDIVKFPIYQLKDMTNNPYDSRINQLIEDISPYFVRIRKSHLNLPPVINHEPIFVEMDSEQREIYDFIESKYISFFVSNEENLSLSSELTKAKFIRLMQAATNPNLLKKPLDLFLHEQGLGNDLYLDDTSIIRKINNYSDKAGLPIKFLVVKDLIVDLLKRGEKVIIWGTFIQNLKELKEYLFSSGIESQLLIGEIPVERDDLPMEDTITREKIIKEFHLPDSKFKVLLANPFAVSESISLHKACHNAIYLERTFNATHFIQSKDRIHRVGLEPGTETHYYFIVSKNSIDETIHTRLSEKEKRMLDLIENQEIPLFSENMDYDLDLFNDIKAIIRDYVNRTSEV